MTEWKGLSPAALRLNRANALQRMRAALASGDDALIVAAAEEMARWGVVDQSLDWDAIRSCVARVQLMRQLREELAQPEAVAAAARTWARLNYLWPGALTAELDDINDRGEAAFKAWGRALRLGDSPVADTDDDQ